jgi:hypothetical protein
MGIYTRIEREFEIYVGRKRHDGGECRGAQLYAEY